MPSAGRACSPNPGRRSLYTRSAKAGTARVGHNLFDGDYRCLRTYGDVVDVGVLAAKTVDTLYAARHVVGGGASRAARLDLTTLAGTQGLRKRAKTASQTEAHRSIPAIHDAEERWFFQPNPSTEADVTAWQDHFDCCEGCSGSFLDISLPERPWGEMHDDGTVTVFAGVSHYELGACP